ncbi:MAG: hypothetical protein QOG23_3900 [Blastocatellia bacterium]|jgi:hypothetical protein|nr:hypothetical protein [Blastocatellia bacterium]
MKRSSLAALTNLFLAPMATYSKSVARLKPISTRPSRAEREQPDEIALAARSMCALKRLEKDVLIYRSLGDFETHGKLARVSYQAFRNDLNEVSSEVEPMLSRLPQSKLKTELSNALASYRDGEFWWQQIDKPRVANGTASAASPSSSDTAFQSSVPYTVTIHWRQANRYLKRAAQLMNSRPTEQRMRPLGVDDTHAAFAPSASAR